MLNKRQQGGLWEILVGLALLAFGVYLSTDERTGAFVVGRFTFLLLAFVGLIGKGIYNTFGAGARGSVPDEVIEQSHSKAPRATADPPPPTAQERIQ